MSWDIHKYIWQIPFKVGGCIDTASRNLQHDKKYIYIYIFLNALFGFVEVSLKSEVKLVVIIFNITTIPLEAISHLDLSNAPLHYGI